MKNNILAISFTSIIFIINIYPLNMTMVRPQETFLSVA